MAITRAPWVTQDPSASSPTPPAPAPAPPPARAAPAQRPWIGRTSSSAHDNERTLPRKPRWRTNLPRNALPITLGGTCSRPRPSSPQQQAASRDEEELSQAPRV